VGLPRMDYLLKLLNLEKHEFLVEEDNLSKLSDFISCSYFSLLKVKTGLNKSVKTAIFDRPRVVIAGRNGTQLLIFGSETDNSVEIKPLLTFLKSKGVELDRAKDQMLLSQVEYNGVLLSSEGFQMSEAKRKTLREWKMPKDVADVRKFLTAYKPYEKFLPRASVAKVKLVNWRGDPCYPINKKAFKRLRAMFEDDHHLSFFNPDAKLTIIRTRMVENCGISATLYQDGRVIWNITTMVNKDELRLLSDAELHFCSIVYCIWTMKPLLNRLNSSQSAPLVVTSNKEAMAICNEEVEPQEMLKPLYEIYESIYCQLQYRADDWEPALPEPG